MEIFVKDIDGNEVYQRVSGKYKTISFLLRDMIFHWP